MGNFSGMGLLVIGGNLGFFVVSVGCREFVRTMMLVPVYVFSYFEPWRLITSPFVTDSFLTLAFVLPAYWSTSTVLEKRFGSVKYCCLFLSSCIFSQLLSLLLCYLFSLNQTVAFNILASQIMTEILIISKKNPESPINFLCCPGKIKSEYYPYAYLFLGFFLGLYLEVICGFLVGQLSNFYIDSKISLSNLRRTTIESLEKSLACACFHLVPKFIPVAEAVEEELPFTFIHPENSPPRNPPPRNYERVKII